ALGRHAAAGGPGPSTRARSARATDGRAVLGAGRADPRATLRRPSGHLARAAKDRAAGHTQRARGGLPRRPGGAALAQSWAGARDVRHRSAASARHQRPGDLRLRDAHHRGAEELLRPGGGAMTAETVKRAVMATAFFAALVGVWQLMVWSRRWSPVLLPSPGSVVEYLRSAIADGSLPEATLVTLRRLLVGVAIGLPLGLLSSAFRFVEDTMGVLALGLQTLPSVCWIPLALLWFGQTEN